MDTAQRPTVLAKMGSRLTIRESVRSDAPPGVCSGETVLSPEAIERAVESLGYSGRLSDLPLKASTGSCESIWLE